ncbi:alcohol dehydrogenase GroESlike domain containing protein [Acanthamoeba castellanii str. Neff]|uniref:Alcohol dehydrogenase GroESlike domain containing protein n=1 Tax=Acanthamoeba castellanii (strain ATCC 30010 / Neff) TaxID=1257118 RepID=L8GKQ7_ACACF|nr:alcohol dehydrogenase GroESlike domain containing protein [Acanthamoeba castellanii str. Neff]ELR13429.1 alcohol dehydrogenase GroESlike domain containing protein [Acanthamoeba castellanii str. Neff]
MELSEEVVAQLLADQHHDHQESIEQEKEQEHLREDEAEDEGSAAKKRRLDEELAGIGGVSLDGAGTYLTTPENLLTTWRWHKRGGAKSLTSGVQRQYYNCNQHKVTGCGARYFVDTNQQKELSEPHIEPNEPLHVSEVDLPSVRGHQVLVKVAAAGVCHTDLHLWDDGYDLGGDKGLWRFSARGLPFPLTPGHEVSGTVQAVGKDVETLRVGTRVVVFPWIGCGQCSRCKQGHDNFCDGVTREIGFSLGGGYAESVMVPHERYVVPLPSGLDLETACLLPCSGLTAYSAIKKTKTGPNDFLVIIGMGGVGLMALKLARVRLLSTIICLDIDDTKLNMARAEGAHYTFNTLRVADIKAEILNLTGGHGAECVIGNYADLEELVAVVDKAKVNLLSIVGERYHGLSQATTALTALRHGQIRGRALLLPSATLPHHHHLH